MESKKINQLATELTPALDDLTIIGDPTTGISKKITLSQMASLFTGTVEEYANFAAFPLVGVADTIYIALDTNVLYRWNIGTSAYVELSPNIINSLVFSDANGFDGNISLVGSVATLTITTALTTGSVPFIGASGALSQDNANLFFDDTNNRLGINTNAPTTALDVFGSSIIGRLNGTSTNNAFLGFSSAGSNKWSIGNVQSDHRFRIYNEATTSELVSVLQTGEFGIGIANPTTKVHIDGGASALIANLDANVSVAKSISFRSDNSNRINLEVSGTESGSNAGGNFFIRAYSDAGALLLTPLTIIRSNGNAAFEGNLLVNISSLSGFGAPKLTIKQSSANDYEGIVIVSSSNDNTLTISHTGTIGRIATNYGLTGVATNLALTTNGVDRLTISALTGNILFGTGLQYDNANLRLGINQLTPLSQLHIVGIAGNNFTDGLRVERNGVPSQYGILNYAGGGYNYLAVNTTTGEPAYNWLTSVNGTTTTTRMTLNGASFMLDVSGTGRFSGNITSNGNTISLINASGSADLVLDRINTSSGATYQYKTNGSLKWYTGLRGLANDSFYIFNNVTSTNTLILDSTTNSATFSGAATFNGNSINLNGNNPNFSLATTNATLYSYIGFEAGTANSSIFQLGNTYASTGGYLAGGLALTSNGAGGISLISANASGEFRVYTGSANLNMTLTSAGYIKVKGVDATTAHNFYQSINNFQIATHTHTGTIPYGLEVAFTGADPNNATNWGLGFYTTNPSFVWIYRIYSNGTVGARSDARWKKNIESTRNGYLEDLCKLRVVKYNWYNHEEDAPKELGLIAQEVEEVFPNLIQYDKVTTKKQVEQEDGTYIEQEVEDGESRSIKISVLPFMLLKGLQEAMEKIEILEQKVKQLELK